MLISVIKLSTKLRRKLLIAGNYTKYALVQTSNLFVMNWFLFLVLRHACDYYAKIKEWNPGSVVWH